MQAITDELRIASSADSDVRRFIGEIREYASITELDEAILNRLIDLFNRRVFLFLSTHSQQIYGGRFMAFFTSAIDTLKVLVIALGAGLGVWGVVNLLEGYGNDNPGANAQVR